MIIVIIITKSAVVTMATVALVTTIVQTLTLSLEAIRRP